MTTYCGACDSTKRIPLDRENFIKWIQSHTDWIEVETDPKAFRKLIETIEDWLEDFTVPCRECQ